MARREFEAVKSARQPGLQPRGDIPRFSVPEMQVPPGAGAPLPQRSPSATDPKSKNWLVEAMEKRGEAGGRGLAPRDRGDREAGTRGFGQPDREGGATTGESPDHERAESKPGSAVSNPLARYLDGWMTPQDYALLKPGIADSITKPGGLAPAVVVKPGAASSSAMPSLNSIAESAAASTREPPRRAAPGRAQENPYLAALRGLGGGPAPVSAGLGGGTSGVPVAPGAGRVSLAPTLAAPTASTSLAAPPPPQPAPAKSVIPEFAKPNNDDKLFKPLKRF